MEECRFTNAQPRTPTTIPRLSTQFASWATDCTRIRPGFPIPTHAATKGVGAKLVFFPTKNRVVERGFLMRPLCSFTFAQYWFEAATARPHCIPFEFPHTNNVLHSQNPALICSSSDPDVSKTFLVTYSFKYQNPLAQSAEQPLLILLFPRLGPLAHLISMRSICI